MTYGPCPNYPGYEATAFGSIRSIERTRITKLGKTRVIKSIVKSPVGRNKAYVTLEGRFVLISAMVADAWPRPESWYPDGRVVTLTEFKAQRGARVD